MLTWRKRSACWQLCKRTWFRPPDWSRSPSGNVPRGHRPDGKSGGYVVNFPKRTSTSTASMNGSPRPSHSAHLSLRRPSAKPDVFPSTRPLSERHALSPFPPAATVDTTGPIENGAPQGEEADRHRRRPPVGTHRCRGKDSAD